MRQMRKQIEENLPLLYLRAARRAFVSMVKIEAIYLDNRYLDRSFKTRTFYTRRSLTLIEEIRLPMGYKEHHRAFRMDKDEFQRLVDLVGHHEVFWARGNRPQTNAALQIAVFVFRLAHGHSVAEVGDRFGKIPGR